MGKYSVLELNSFLTKLIEGYDEASALAIVSTFHELPISKDEIEFESHVKEDASSTGYTNEAGNINIPNREVKEIFIGEKKEEFVRVGHYKVKRGIAVEGKSDVITWYHFWASDINTMNDDAPPSIFGIEYVKEGMKPVALLRWDFTLDESRSRLTLYEWFNTTVLAALRLFFFNERYEFIKRFWVANPTILFGQSKMDITK